jgi:peptidoglycan/xylan/chitin deacetylase (PgdA/CDA1 family)
VPAAFYVTTEFLTEGIPLWFDRRQALLDALGYCPEGLELHTLKQLPITVLNERLDRICTHHRVSCKMDSDHVRPMSWKDARSLARRGFVIGAHGCTHAILTRETPDVARAEIKQSLDVVSSELGTPCRTFAFPNGNYTTELAQHALRCGASTVMTTAPAWTNRHSFLWRLPRIQVFGEFTRARIELKIALAGVRGVLRNPDGTGRAYRRVDRGLQTTPSAIKSEAQVSPTP